MDFTLFAGGRDFPSLLGGLMALTLLLGTFLYPLRRRWVNAPGATHRWLRFHTFAGIFFLPLVLFHSGFRLPTGGLDWGVWLMSFWVVASGVAGSLLQRWIPRILTSGLSTEVHFDRIRSLVDSLRDRSQLLVEESGQAVQDFFRQELAHEMKRPRPRLIYFMDITGGIQSQRRRFRYLSKFLSPEDQERLDELEALFTTKLELDAHYTLQQTLRWWIRGHVPFSILLLLLVLLHVFLVTYY